jgi:hypothetical protein
MSRFSLPQPGTFLVSYGSTSEMESADQADLLTAIDREARVGAIGIAFEVHMVRVEASVPNFWLEVVRAQPNLVALAVASPSLPVRLTTEAFALATRMRKTPIAVRSFVHGGDALDWVGLQLRVARVAPAAVWRIQGE